MAFFSIYSLFFPIKESNNLLFIFSFVIVSGSFEISLAVLLSILFSGPFLCLEDYIHKDKTSTK